MLQIYILHFLTFHSNLDIYTFEVEKEIFFKNAEKKNVNTEKVFI